MPTIDEQIAQSLRESLASGELATAASWERGRQKAVGCNARETGPSRHYLVRP